MSDPKRHSQGPYTRETGNNVDAIRHRDGARNTNPPSRGDKADLPPIEPGTDGGTPSTEPASKTHRASPPH